MASIPRLPRDTGPGPGAGHGEPIQMLNPFGGAAFVGAIGDASVTVGPFPAGAPVAIWTDLDCWFLFGVAPIAATRAAPSIPLSAKQREYYPLGTGNTHIAVINYTPGTSGTFVAAQMQ